jgi:3',5'-nucleoside bisphosphate phosphatase
VRIDLHCHSTHSDGSYPAAEVAARAAAYGVELFCLTDHDTCAGYEATAAVLRESGCRVLRGLELSCKEYDRTVHVLVYGVRSGPALDAFVERLESIAVARRERLRRICERLDTLGVHLDADAIVARAHGRTAGRPDVARALVEAGVCSSPREAFTRFLRDEGPAYVAVDRISVSEGLALGHSVGARMSLAHPHTLRSWALVRDLFVRHRDDGLEGIEALYGSYGPAEREGWVRLAREFDLVLTGGSDFHGDMTPDITRPGIEVDDAVAARLLAWLD